jgi:hypothetical protein
MRPKPKKNPRNSGNATVFHGSVQLLRLLFPHGENAVVSGTDFFPENGARASICESNRPDSVKLDW